MHTPTAAHPDHTAAAVEMERAHVLIRLQQQTPPPSSTSDALARKADGVTRTSATTVRLEHSDMSPGVASITFEQVYDQQHSSAHIFEQSLAPAVAKCAHGFATSLVLTGAPRSGKSFTSHGDKQQEATGMITLALRQVFKELERIQEAEPEFEYQVLLACFHVVDDQLVDLMQTPPVSVVSSTALSTEETLLQRSVLVENTVEAVHCYSQAHAKSRQATSGKSDFVIMVHVETKRPNEQVRRGRLMCIDIHGSSILEPTRWQDSASQSPENDDGVGAPGGARKPFFSDTHFPVATGLSNWFGGFVGNESATYMLITIQKQAQYQQQAIQSLLYACKAKDIKSTNTITYVSALTNRKMMQRQQNTTNTPAAKEVEDESDSRVFSNENQTEAHESTSTPSSPVSATLSDSTGEFLMASNGTGFDRGLATTAVGYGSPKQSENQTLLSQRLQKAYQSVKSSNLGDPLNSILVSKKKHVEVESGRGKHDHFEGLFATKANFLHAKADAMLKPQSHELQALSLLDKLELIHFQHQEVEKSLAQETSIKEKCVDRISKLSQTMSFQVIEHEKQMQQVLQEKERVQNQLTAMELKFEDVSKEIEQLQQQVHLVKMSREEAQTSAALLASASLVSSDSSERVLLQQFSSRLEAAMEEAKGVVDFKDGVIWELERRLEESAQASARFSKELARQKLSHEQEKADLLNEISDLKSAVQRYEEAAARDATRVEEQRSELMATISHLTSEIKAFDTKWAAREQEHAQALVQARQDCLDNEGADDAENQSRLEELLTKKTRECVVSQAASAASHRNAQLLQARIEEIAYKMERKKKKMEKKMKALVSDRKLHKTASSRQALDLARQVEDFQIKEEQMHREITDLHEELHQHESNEVGLRAEIEQLQRTSSKLEKQVLELQQQLGALEVVNHTLKDQHQSAEAKLQRQIYEMEQSLARRLLEREAHLVSEHERKLKKMMDRHSAELLQRDVHDEYTPRSASSLASTVSDSEMLHQQQQQQQQQHSIDQLDALIDSKERQYTRSRDTTPRSDRKKPSSGRQEQKLAELKKKLSELTQALAVANEQETLAKAQAQKIIDAHQESLSQRDHLLEEMNRLKKENWSLSLALQVTERQRQ